MAVKGGTLEYDTSLNTKGLQKGLNGLKTSSVAIGNIIANAFTKITSTISASMDDAVKRLDALNNFPKVMSNLGISSDKSQKAIDKLSEKLKGLPTTLDAGAMAVQRFTSKNGDVQKSTDLFLALNNAILAGGAGADIQASAIEQMAQAYAKGKPDMMEWRTAMMAMPAQLKQVATAMGYVDADALGEALRKGDVSMEKFMDTIVKLNEKGLPGLENFDKQARNATGGIETSITNMKTAVARGVANLIDSLDKGLKGANLGGVSDLISKIGSTFEKGLSGLGKFLQPIITGLLDGSMNIEEASSIILKKITGIIDNIIKKLPEFIKMIIDGIVQTIPSFIKAISDVIHSIIRILPELIPTLVNGIIDALLTILDNIDVLIDAGVDLIIALAVGIVEAIPLIVEKMPIIIEKLLNALVQAAPKLLHAAKRLIEVLGNGLINSIPLLLKQIPKIMTAIGGAFAKLLGKMADIGKNILKGIWQGIMNAKDWLLKKIASFAAGILKAFLKAFKIGSPSKLMRDRVGQWIPKGLAVGIEANTDAVEKAMKDIDDLVVGSLDGAIGYKNNMFNNGANLMANYSLGGNIIVQGNLESNVTLDGRKVGQETAPFVMKAIKNGGV